jgi:hypothetical protein
MYEYLNHIVIATRMSMVIVCMYYSTNTTHGAWPPPGIRRFRDAIIHSTSGVPVMVIVIYSNNGHCSNVDYCASVLRPPLNKLVIDRGPTVQHRHHCDHDVFLNLCESYVRETTITLLCQHINSLLNKLVSNTTTT